MPCGVLINLSPRPQRAVCAYIAVTGDALLPGFVLPYGQLPHPDEVFTALDSDTVFNVIVDLDGSLVKAMTLDQLRMHIRKLCSEL